MKFLARVKKRWLVRISVALLSVIVTVNYLAWTIYAYPFTAAPVQADAAIVLGAAAWGERPSPVFRERINYAIALYERGAVRKLIFTGAQADASEPAEAVVAQQYALDHGIPADDILIETRSHSTQENLYYAQQVAQAQHLSRLLIVSDPLHLKRAVLIAQDLGMDAYPAPTPTTRYRSLSSQFKFLTRETYFYTAYLLYDRPFRNFRAEASSP
ncbi:MAG: YdcF family protein [Anaerolineales bacterium]|nr:YdcF family protein [Anaerolineales bacterium]